MARLCLGTQNTHSGSTAVADAQVTLRSFRSRLWTPMVTSGHVHGEQLESAFRYQFCLLSLRYVHKRHLQGPLTTLVQYEMPRVGNTDHMKQGTCTEIFLPLKSPRI